MRAGNYRASRPTWDWRSASVIFLCIMAADVAVGFAYTQAGFWVIVGGLVAAAAVVFLFLSPSALIFTIFVAKPIIDMLWFASADIAGVSLNAQSVLSTVTIGVALLTIMIRRLPLPPWLFAPMLLVLTINVYALAVTGSFAYSAEYLIRLVCGFPLVFVVPALIEEIPEPRRLIRLFLIVMAFVCLTVLLQPMGLLGYKSFDSGGYSRATGFYYHPWDVARYVIVAIPLLLALVDEPGRVWFIDRWPYFILLIVLIAVTYFTFLKAAWITVFFEILLWLLLTGRPRIAAAFVVLVVIFAAIPGRSFLFSVFSDLWKLTDADSRGQALSGRVFIWSEYWKDLGSIGIRDLLFGQGFKPAGFAATGRAAHDDYLRLVVMNGIVGLAAYLALVVAAAAALAKAVRQLSSTRGLEWRIGNAVLCLLAAYLLMGITADPSSYPSLTMYLWLLIGLVLGYARLQRERSAGASAVT